MGNGARIRTDQVAHAAPFLSALLKVFRVVALKMVY